MKKLIQTAVVAAAFFGNAIYAEPGSVFDNLPTSLDVQAQKISKTAIIVDTHIDVPFRLKLNGGDVTQATQGGDFDYPRAKSGGLNAPFMSIYVPASDEQKGIAYDSANGLIDIVENIVATAPKKFAIAKTVSQVRQQFLDGVISLPLGMENGGPVEGSLAKLQHFYDRGIRYITLAHSKSNHISDSSYDANKQWQGLSPFGKTMVKEMNNLGIMVDVSHISDQSFYQVMELSAVPVIASHSSARHFVPDFERNMSDQMIQRLAQNGGVIQINFGSSFISGKTRNYSDILSQATANFMAEHEVDRRSDAVKGFVKDYRQQHPYPYASTSDVLDHIDHVVKLTGVDHVGIGSDYDGVGDSLPVGLKDVSSYPVLIAGLLERGYTEPDINKILGENLLRVWSAVEVYAQKQATAAQADAMEGFLGETL